MIFNAGDTAYIIENGIRVKPVKILSRIGDMYTVRVGRGAICVRHTRPYQAICDSGRSGENYVRGSAEKKGVSFPI